MVLASWTEGIKTSALQEMLIASRQPGLLSFALGLPSAELFPTDEFAVAMASVLHSDQRALQYGPPFHPLKEQIVELMRQRGVACTAQQIFLTTGAQQGTNLLTRLLLDPGGSVLLEEKTYTGFQQVLQPYQPHVIKVPTDLSTGIDVSTVELVLQRGERPALIYVVTDGHNPLSVSMSLENRYRLIELARQYQIPIIEDDPYGFICYESDSIPPLRAFEDRWVLYVGTFSKILAPAVRTGWIVVPEELVPYLAIIKESIDIDMAPLSQRAISAYLETEAISGHLITLKNEYGRRRDTMLNALETFFPVETHWRKPSSGLFIWVELPDYVDTWRLFNEAIEKERIAFIPGQAFDVGLSKESTNGLRLNFSNSTIEQIEDGISRLGGVLKAHLV